MGFDVAQVRGTDQLSHSWTYLNAADGPLIPELVMSAVNTSFRTARTIDAPATSGGTHARAATPTRHSASFDLSARRAVADLLGAKADCVILGPDIPTLIQALMSGLPWPSPQAVVARTLPQAILSRFAGLDVTFAEPDLGTGELPTWQFNELVTGATRLVMVPAADPLIGQVTDIATISDHVRSRSRAWLIADLTALAPYRPVHMNDLGADIALIDFAALGGPEVAALILRDTSMFLRLKEGTFDHLRVAPALLGAVAPTVDHLAGLDADAPGNRRHRLAHSGRAAAEWLAALDTYAIDSLIGLGVHVAGISGDAAAGDPRNANRIGRITFTMPGIPATTIHQRLLAHGIVTTLAGEQSPLVTLMGIEEAGGGITVGLAPYNKHQDVDQLIRAVASLA